MSCGERVGGIAHIRKLRIPVVQLPLTLLEGQAVERVAHAAHALLVAVVNARYAGYRELYRRAQPLLLQRAGKRSLAELILHLILARELTQVSVRRAQTVDVVRAQQVHKRIVQGLRVIHLLRYKKIAQPVSVRPAVHEAQHRRAQRVVHHRVERIAQCVIAA